jgi:hypothetical protein
MKMETQRELNHIIESFSGAVIAIQDKQEQRHCVTTQLAVRETMLLLASFSRSQAN